MKENKEKVVLEEQLKTLNNKPIIAKGKWKFTKIMFAYPC